MKANKQKPANTIENPAPTRELVMNMQASGHNSKCTPDSMPKSKEAVKIRENQAEAKHF